MKPVLLMLVAAALIAACTQQRAQQEQAIIRDHYAPRLQALIRDDVVAHEAAVKEAANRLAPGFAVEDAARREREMRAALRIVQSPKKGIKTFVASPMTFLAAIDEHGIVIARDRKNDTMKGKDFKARFPVVERALTGNAGYALGEFFAKNPSQPSSISMLFAAPARRDDQTVGVVLAGIPLYRMAQRLQLQLRVEHAADVERGVAIWVYVYEGDRLFHWDTSPRVDEKIPSALDRNGRLSASPTGFTDALVVAGDAYVYGTFPTPDIGANTGLVIVRAGP